MRFLMLALLALLPAFSQTLSVMVPLTVVPPGTSGTVQIVLSTPTTGVQPAALQFQISSNGTDTGSLSAVAGPAATAAGKQLSCTGPAVLITCVVWGMNGNLIGNGDVADVTVPVLATASHAVAPITLGGALGASVAGVSITEAMVSASLNIFSSCDLDHNGTVDLNDVNLVVAQALGNPVCTTGDLTKDLKCNVLDVYREVLAALPISSGIAGAGVCKVGP